MSVDSEALLRRRANFFRGTKMQNPPFDPIRNDSSLGATKHDGGNSYLVNRGGQFVQDAVALIVQSLGLPVLPPGQLAAIVDRALPALRGMSARDLAGLSPSSAIIASIALSAAAPALPPNAVEKLKREYLARSLDGTGKTLADASRDEGGRLPLSRFDGRGFGSSNVYAGLAGTDQYTQGDRLKIAEARTIADRYGMGWLGSSELLAIGAAGVKAIGEVHLREQSYKRLRTEGRFEAKDVVTLAGYAKSKGIKDANKLANAAADAVQLGNGEQEQHRIKAALVDYMSASKALAAKPNDPTAQQRMHAASENYRNVMRPLTEKSEHSATVVKKFEDEAKIVEKDRISTMSVEKKAAAQDKKNDNDLAALAETANPPDKRASATQPIKKADAQATKGPSSPKV
jgi:hypothetical protein